MWISTITSSTLLTERRAVLKGTRSGTEIRPRRTSVIFMQKPTPFDKKILPDYEIYGSIVYEIVDIVKTIVRKNCTKRKGIGFMITNGFTYIAVLVFIAALLVWLQRYTKSKFFDYAPPIVLLYLITMILCTLGAWDMEATKPAYSVLKNNLLYAMIFLMLLRCDIRKIIKLGPKMLGGFFAASVSISLAFIATFAIMKGPLGSEAWKALGALCGSWMGGSGNMIAVQAALDIGEADMAYALVVDSIDYSIWVMFLLWAINLAPKFNKWVKADTTTLDEVSRRLEEDAKGNEDKASFVNLIFLLGLALVISAFGQDIGAALNGAMPFLDKATWTVLLITLSGLIGAVTPVGRMAGSTELSNLLLYSVVALLASRASFLELTDAPAWILAGFMILAIHGIILVLLAKIFHLDMFTCGVASLANIGGSASAPILAGACWRFDGSDGLRHWHGRRLDHRKYHVSAGITNTAKKGLLHVQQPLFLYDFLLSRPDMRCARARWSAVRHQCPP